MASSTSLIGSTISPFIAPAVSASATPTGSPAIPASTPSNHSSTNATLGNAMGNISQGVQAGGAAGDLQSSLSVASLLNKSGAFGSSSPQVGGVLGAAGGALGVYNGINQGGVSGYGSATVGALRAGSSVAGLAGNSALAGGLSSAAGYLAAPLALYNFGKNWQSGATGSDALNGAEAGAAVGSIIPVVGTAIGALIGGAVGALSSAFGGGKKDPESVAVDNMDAAATTAQGKQQVQQALTSSPSTAFQYLAGVMDAKNNTPGHSQPIEQAFGRMGEGNMVTQMTAQINSALSSGAVAKNATPDQIYQTVVQPWLASKNAAIDPNSVDVDGQNAGTQLTQSLEGLIGSWQSGQLTDSTPIGGSGQKLTGLQAYGS